LAFGVKASQAAPQYQAGFIKLQRMHLQGGNILNPGRPFESRRRSPATRYFQLTCAIPKQPEGNFL